jgi:hypothetical protein
MTWHHRTTYAVITTYAWGSRIRVFCSPCNRLVQHHHCRLRLWPARMKAQQT